MSVSPALLDQTLAAQGDALVAYVRQRLGPGAAEDVVQDALLRLAEHAPELDDQAGLTRWLWRVVRNATTDVHRRAEAAGRREDAWAADQPDAVMPPGEEATLCACYRPLLDDLDPAHADLLRAELGGEPPAALAGRLGVSAGALRVRRHRARRQLGERLADVCRACAGCLDCSCAPPPPDPPVSLPTPTMHTTQNTDDQTLRFGIEGMTCGGCVASATRALERMPGVTVDKLDLSGDAVVRLSGMADREVVRGAVEGAGFRPVFDAA
ncbi:sigma-70 family RNA polymerase sigma factor [Rubrivirga sp. S365]|uniref:sigma-70 family RNA polymerase sigma factor n=1 Tax=Rubrivirga sp. S365 TaxID=3076080 RepID=UPI0028C86DAE|nr:sigma-70 family RNA polymerase sigma factor [Rubrivirga sp. S365]MDT7858036.1 sigma-70 family RNA polymerase sigma factor [Rubrivirga sp. S365]